MTRSDSILALVLLLLHGGVIGTPAWAEAILRGKITTFDDRPVAGARISLEPQKGAEPARSDADGIFEIAAPRDGFWQVRAAPSGATTFVLDLPHATDSRDLAPLVLPSPDPEGRIDGRDRGARHPAGTGDGPWRPANGEAAADKAADGEPVAAPAIERTGRVIDAAERSPVVGAAVWWHGDPRYRTITDPEGAYRLALPARASGARLAIGVAATGYVTLEATPIEEPSSAVIALRRAAEIHGRVIDGRGQPVVGARLAASLAEKIRPEARETLWAWSDRRGAFQLRGLTPAQSYWLRVHGAGHVGDRLTVGSTSAGLHPSVLEIVLPAGRRAVGQVLGTDDRPVANATIRALPSTTTSTSADVLTAGEAAEEAYGDARGRFELPLLPLGEIDLHVSARGFGPRLLRGLDLPPGDEPADLGIVRLETGAAVRGRVIDVEGAPIAGATIHAMGEEMGLWTGGAGVVAAPRTTGADGGFTFTEREPGEALRLWVRHPAFVSRTLAAVAERGTPEALTIELMPAARLAGRVVDRDGEGIEGAAVMVENYAGRPLGSARSAADGRFLVTGLDAGSGDAVRLQLTVLAAGFVPAATSGLELWPGESRDGVELLLSRGARLAGRVVDGAGEGVAGARIASLDNGVGSRLTDLRVTETHTGGDGHFQLSGLRSGRHRLTVEHADYLAARASVRIDADEAELEIRLRRGSAVSGRVVDDTGQPVAGAEVMLLTGRSLPAPVRSSFDGTFRFAAVEPGEYRLRAEKEGLAAAGRSLRVPAEPLEDLELRLGEGGRVSGRIFGLDADELARLRIAASGPGVLGVLGRVGHDGMYRLTGLPPGEWVVTAALDSRQTQGRILVPESGGAVDLDLEFAAGLSLTGRVEYAGGPVPGALVALRDGAMGVGGARVDSAGRFHIGGLEAGVYEVTVRDPLSGLVGERHIALEGDLEIRLELRAREAP